MKKTLKLAGLLLALVMVLSMLPVMASADDPVYTITVNIPSGTDNAGGSTHESYTAWKVLTIESSTPTTAGETTPTELATATYKVDTDWESFFTEGAGKDYFTVDAQKYVTVTDGVTLDDATMATIAKAAVAYAGTKGLTGVTQSVAADATSVALNVGGPGWYAVNSSVGTICMLTNNDPTDTIADKNLVPTVAKEVTSITGAETGDTNTVSVGDTVNYTATITAEPGAENYVFHDTMDAGLTFDATSVKIGGTAIADVAGASLVTSPTDSCTFEITFTQAYLDDITAETSIVITYSAVVNADAIDDTGAIDNTAKLTYGDNSKVESTPASADVYTYGFEIIKTDENNKVISGATFELYDAATGGNKILLTKDGDVYRPATATEIAAAGYASPEVPATTAKFDGFGNGTYYLQEVANPDGYNKLANRVAVTINGKDIFLTKTFAVGDEYTQDDASTTGTDESDGGIQIINKQGSVLPETGGMGTTLLYVVGAILVIGAGVLLVSKKRMAAK